MTQATTTAENGRADALLASYERAGYARVCPKILQPAEPFLALSGEDIRRRMYLVSDAAGREFCLRPDLTIPVALDYLASDAAGRPASFCYLGPVFRQRAEACGEFVQLTSQYTIRFEGQLDSGDSGGAVWAFDPSDPTASTIYAVAITSFEQDNDATLAGGKVIGPVMTGKGLSMRN